MDKKLKVTVSETIDAPVSKVWDALTNKEIIKEYFFGTETETDWKVGSPIFFRGTWDGQEYEDKGTILEKEEEKLLKYNYWSSLSGTEDVPENYATVAYKLDTDQGQTVVTVEQKGFRNQEACDHSLENWKGILKEMKTLVEKK